MNEQQPGVLIAEDETDINELLALVLRMEKFRVFQAVDGEEALRIFTENQDSIHLLVTDLGLPKLGGVELIEKIRAMKPSMRIIGASGYGRKNVHEEVIGAGGDDFMPKPYDTIELVARAKKMLGLL